VRYDEQALICICSTVAEKWELLTGIHEEFRMVFQIMP
jgi:hypothetical protein